jgi:hypothetical protein
MTRRRREAVNRRRAEGRAERLAVGVGSVRIGAEVVIERHVFLEDHDDVLDRGRGSTAAVVVAVTVVRSATGRRLRHRDAGPGYYKCCQKQHEDALARH